MKNEINKLIKELEAECKPWEDICRLSDADKKLNLKHNWGTCVGEVVLRSAWQIHILKELKKRLNLHYDVQNEDKTAECNVQKIKGDKNETSSKI